MRKFTYRTPQDVSQDKTVLASEPITRDAQIRNTRTQETMRKRLSRWWDMLLWWLLPVSIYRKLPDHCEVCHGERGGVRGNENVVESCGERVIMCDYCSAHEMLAPGFWNSPGFRKLP